MSGKRDDVVKPVRGSVARGSATLTGALCLVLCASALATTITVPNGDFSSATNANAGSPIGGGLLTPAAAGVAIGTTGPWTGSYQGDLGVVAPPTLQINSTTHVASIDGLVGNVLGSLVANSGSFDQVLPNSSSDNLYRANKVYTLEAHVDAADLVGVNLLTNGIFGIALTGKNGSNVTTFASSDTNPATLTLLSPGHYDLSLPLTTPASGPPLTRQIGASLFSRPKGLASLTVLSTISFSNVTLRRVGTVPAVIAVTIGSQSGSQNATVGQAFAHPLSVTVVDSDGDAVPGVSVTFAAPAGSASATLVPATPVTTDGNGVATVAATAKTLPGEYTVTAVVAGVAVPATFDLTNVAGPPSAIAIVPPAPTSATVGTAFGGLNALVTDLYGNAVANGTTIAATASIAGNGASTQTTVVMTTTTGAGAAAFAETANTIAGSYSVTLTAGAATSLPVPLSNIAGAARKVKPGVDGSLSESGTPQSTTVASAFALPLAVLVTDQYDNPVSGALVTFTPPASGAGATLSSNSPTTDAAGIAAVTATANTVAGLYHIPATVASGTQATTFDLTNTAAVARKVKPGVDGNLAQSGTPQSTTVATAFTVPLTVLVTDQYDNPVSGASVTFTPPASGAGANLSTNSPTTNGSGVAAVTATANTVAGLYHIPATVASGTQSTTFDLTNTAGPASKVKPGVGNDAAASGTPQSATITTAFALPLKVLVTDQYDNPVAAAAVNFDLPVSGAAAQLSANPAMTNASGVAAVTAVANSVAGLYHIPASVTGGLQSLTFDLTNIGATTTLIGGTPQVTVSGDAFGCALIVKVNDENGPVAGIGIQFTAIAALNGASATFSSIGGAEKLNPLTVFTDVGGVAAVEATSNAIGGSFTATAGIAGAVQFVTYELTNLAVGDRIFVNGFENPADTCPIAN